MRRRFASHLWPRTRAGRRALLGFLFFLVLAQPPVVLVANRIEPRIAALPFLYVWLLVAYLGMIGALVYAWRRGV
jgi:hypothetical protein